MTYDFAIRVSVKPWHATVQNIARILYREGSEVKDKLVIVRYPEHLVAGIGRNSDYHERATSGFRRVWE